MDTAATAAAKIGTAIAAAVAGIVALRFSGGAGMLAGFDIADFLYRFLRGRHRGLALGNGIVGFRFLHIGQIAQAGSAAIGLPHHVQTGPAQGLIANVGQYGQIVQGLLGIRAGRGCGVRAFRAIGFGFVSHNHHHRAKKTPASSEVRGYVGLIIAPTLNKTIHTS